MKLTRCLALPLIALFVRTAAAESSPVMLRVTASGGDRHDEIKNSTASVHHQHKELTATLTNLSREELKGLTVKWYAFGREMKGDRLVIIGSASNAVTLGAAKTGTNTFEAASTYTPDHSVVTTSRNRLSGKKHTSVKEVAG